MKSINLALDALTSHWYTGRLKNVAPTFWNIFTLVKSFCGKFCKFVGNLYPHYIYQCFIFILIFHQMAMDTRGKKLTPFDEILS